MEKGERVKLRLALLALAFALPLTACAQEDTIAPAAAPAPATATVTAPNPSTVARVAQDTSVAIPTMQDSKDFQALKVAEVNRPTSLRCQGIEKQGGLVLCRTQPFAKVKIGRTEDDFYYETADSEGLLIVGFDRDETQTFVEFDGTRVRFDLAARDYDTSRINGLPSNMVNEYSEAELKRIRAATARKKIGFASRATDVGFKNGFIYPIQADYIKTTNFGAQRILNDVPKKPHYGVDLAAPKGTPIVAPADGIVSLADDDMYFEGSLILIDHGQGLISYYLHNDTVLVTDGQAVTQGEQIATVGSRGRSTGPHLCWRLKWRNRNLDPELLTEWPDDY